MSISLWIHVPHVGCLLREKHLEFKPKKLSICPEFTHRFRMATLLHFIIIFIWVTMVDSIYHEITVMFLNCIPCREPFSEFWADWCYQYGIFHLESQMLLSGDSRGTQLEAAVFTGYMAIYCYSCLVIITVLLLLFLMNQMEKKLDYVSYTTPQIFRQ